MSVVPEIIGEAGLDDPINTSPVWLTASWKVVTRGLSQVVQVLNWVSSAIESIEILLLFSLNTLFISLSLSQLCTPMDIETTRPIEIQ